MKIKEQYPQVIDRIERFPVRIKTAKSAGENSLVLLKRKGLGIFSLYYDYTKTEQREIEFAGLLQKVKCDFSTEKLELSPMFWHFYEIMEKF